MAEAPTLVGIPLSLLERLAPADQYAYIGDTGECFGCDGGDYTAAEWFASNAARGRLHAADCPWIEARKLIEEAKRG